MKEQQKEKLNGVNLTWVEKWVKNSLEDRIKVNELVLETIDNGDEIYVLRKHGVTTYQLESVIVVDGELKDLIKQIRDTETQHGKLIRQLRKFMVKTQQTENN